LIEHIHEPRVIMKRNGVRMTVRAPAERLWAKVDRSDDLDCWPWTGYRNPHGYGQVGIDGRLYLAHRVAYEAAIGVIPEGLGVLHSCDNPPCCNPAHLRPGGQLENGADMVSRGRAVDMRNERCGKARLTNAQVEEIRVRHAGGETLKALAPEYGVHRAYLSRVVRYLRRPLEAPAVEVPDA
jgi:hypothetical protein